MQTKKVAVSIVAALVLALVAPVFAQPFADVPTDHWAYDAIAELAAKGLIEGYPDGTFKGNQPLTRYEMAMVVARIIARIEAIPAPTPPPAPPPPQVTRRDIETLQRLINEFRAELQALGVRVTALEEELAALRARLDNTRITGVFQYLYWGLQEPAQAPRHGLNRVQLTYAGTITPDLSATLRVRHQTAGNPNTGTGTTGDPGTPVPPVLATTGTIFFDRAYLDWRNALGVSGLSLRLGRDAVALGPIGLLLDAVYWNERREGLQARWTVGPVALLGAVQWATLAQNTTAYMAVARASFDPIPGWTLGVNVRSDTDPWVAAYGGLGFSVDLRASVLAGVTLTAEYASYTPTGTFARNYIFASAALDLGRLAGIEMLAPRLTVWYKNLDPVTGVFPAGAPRPNPRTVDTILGLTPSFVGDIQAFGGQLDLTLFENVAMWGMYETGNQKSTNLAYSGWEVGARWAFAARSNLWLFYGSQTLGATTLTHWGAFVSTSW
ncbi:MAG: S-layer homology domain-containing protein [Armatimonadota bacterium]|nr:S-layer homology domain-containing protein [Armatimonadota bacterium]